MARCLFVLIENNHVKHQYIFAVPVWLVNFDYSLKCLETKKLFLFGMQVAL